MLRILMVIVLVAPLCQCVEPSKECDRYPFKDGFTAGKIFYRNNANLTQVPDDIPYNALGVWIYCNQITHLPANVFSNLRACGVLAVQHCLISRVDLGAFNGMDSLHELYICHEMQLFCDLRLCWLKREEEAGTMNFTLKGNVYLPRCVGEQQWSQFTCPASIPCHDPGQVEFSQRSTEFLPFPDNSASGLPFSTNYRLRYTCDMCYTGGGTITCQSGGQWTAKPMCVIQQDSICRAPILNNGQFIPLSKEYGCGVKVTFTCDEGFTLGGSSERTCGGNGEFIGGTPTCTQNSSTALIVGVVVAVVGMVIIGVIVLTAYIIKRRTPQSLSTTDHQQQHQQQDQQQQELRQQQQDQQQQHQPSMAEVFFGNSEPKSQQDNPDLLVHRNLTYEDICEDEPVFLDCYNTAYKDMYDGSVEIKTYAHPSQ